MRKDIIKMSQNELKRLHIVHKILNKEIKQTEASELLNISDRQTRRIVKKVREEGDKAITHKSRDKKSNRAIKEKTKRKILKLYNKKYRGFGPTLAQEKIEETEGIKISNETLRKWLISEQIWLPRRKRKKHLSWRQRKEYFGQMVQMDGSHHDWFEGRGPKCVLMGYIDDATGKIFGKFYEYEGTIPAMDSFKRYIRKYGIPQSIYLDKHTTYKSPAKLTIEDELAGRKALSQFERALHELGVKVIHAHSPQAKGRIERLFKTLQDRLIKEMRLKRIKNIEQANDFLKSYLPVYNNKFIKKAQQDKDLHRPKTRQLDLDSILCIKTERVLRNDHTVAFNSELYQINDNIKTKKVTIEEKIDGRKIIKYKGKKLKYSKITKVKEKTIEMNLKKRKSRALSMDHPLKKAMFEKQQLLTEIKLLKSGHF